MRAPLLLTSTSLLALALVPAAHGQGGDLPNVNVPSLGSLRVERLATLEQPWGMALLPDGRLLITEKPGRLRFWENGRLSEPVQGVPPVAYRGGRDQGGLMDVALHPSFSRNRLIFFSYTEADAPASTEDGGDPRLSGVEKGDMTVRGGVVARGRLDGNRLEDVRVIWRQTPRTQGRGHFGNRLVFAPDGKLLITSADRVRFEPAQDLQSNLGKVVRINPDGSIPRDNPFRGRKDALPEIWSYGHRNILSAVIEPGTDRLWAVEMGPRGGDELNLVRKGQNYGWPVVGEGVHYGGQAMPAHSTRPEMAAPVVSWTPVISPSGAAFYTGSRFPQWRGSLLIGGLSSQAVIRLTLDGTRVAAEERIEMKRRIRDVIEAPDGAILVLVDGSGELLRLTPANAGRE